MNKIKTKKERDRCAKLCDRVEILEQLLAEAYGYTTAANDLLPERIKAALRKESNHKLTGL